MFLQYPAKGRIMKNQFPFISLLHKSTQELPCCGLCDAFQMPYIGFFLRVVYFLSAHRLVKCSGLKSNSCRKFLTRLGIKLGKTVFGSGEKRGWVVQLVRGWSATQNVFYYHQPLKIDAKDLFLDDLAKYLTFGTGQRWLTWHFF